MPYADATSDGDDELEGIPKATWRQLHVEGTGPCKRDCHTAVFYEGCMYIFGGWSGEVKLCDLQVFNFESRRWLSCNTFGCAPSPREGHSAVIYKNHMIIFGGQGDGMNFRDCYSFSFDDHTWRYLDTSVADELGRCTSALSTSGSFSEQGSLNCLGPPAQACGAPFP